MASQLSTATKNDLRGERIFLRVSAPQKQKFPTRAHVNQKIKLLLPSQINRKSSRALEPFWCDGGIPYPQVLLAFKEFSGSIRIINDLHKGHFRIAKYLDNTWQWGLGRLRVDKTFPLAVTTISRVRAVSTKEGFKDALSN